MNRINMPVSLTYTSGITEVSFDLTENLGGKQPIILNVDVPLSLSINARPAVDDARKALIKKLSKTIEDLESLALRPFGDSSDGL